MSIGSAAEATTARTSTAAAATSASTRRVDLPGQPPELCLGVIDFESQARLFRWRRWLSVCSNDWPESPGDYPYEAFANSGKCRGGGFDEDVGTVADIAECWRRCQGLNEDGRTSYCASMHQTTMACSCQGADPDGDFDEFDCLADVGEYTLAVHRNWRGSRCYGNDGRVCACDGGDYCLPWTGDYYLPWTWPHMAGPFKEDCLESYACSRRIQLAARPWRLAEGARGPLLGRDPGLMARAGGSGAVAFFWILVGVIVYRCKKWCADVVARIEAIESTMEVRAKPTAAAS